MYVHVESLLHSNGFIFLYAKYTAYENINELEVNNIRINSNGLSLNRHFKENEKFALHPYILHSLFARIKEYFYIGCSCMGLVVKYHGILYKFLLN